jgi:uncharacterized protein
VSDVPQPPPPGWYDDGTTLRWWDGAAWGPAAPPAGLPSVEATDPVSEGTSPAVVSHVGILVFAVVLPLVFRLTEGKKNEFVRHHSTESLNFQLTFLILWIMGGVATMFATFSRRGGDDASAWFLLPFLTMFGLFGVAVLCAIVGAVRASQGRWWRYPVSIRFVSGARPERDHQRSA